MDDMTIFISLASYCDGLLEQTVRNALEKAKHPSRLRFGIVEQNFYERRLKYDDIKSQVRYVGIDIKDARGACWARSLAMSLYSGETWFLQVDAHTVFDQDWDESLLIKAAVCSMMSPKFVMSSYPSPFFMREGVIVPEKSTTGVMVSLVNPTSEFREEDLILTFIGNKIVETNTPIEAFHIAGGFVFTHGRFVYEVPYDPNMYFEGEEQTLTVRAYTHGWNIYHVPNVPVYHLYSTPDVASNFRETHWVEREDKVRSERWWDLDRKAKARMVAMLQYNADLGIYGLGKQRTLTEFANFSGIDYRNKTLSKHAKER
jgi:hypothetical protein